MRLLLGLGICCVAAAVMQLSATGAEEKASKKVLRHVVMFGFKESSSEADVKTVVDAFRNLPNEIPEIA
ncbi:MAG: Dabb family protein, partial [Rhodopirellula bahusiensis]